MLNRFIVMPIKRTIQNLAWMDVMVLTFLLYFNVRLLLVPDSPEATIARPVFALGLGMPRPSPLGH